MSQPKKIEKCLYALLESGVNGLRQVEIASPHQGYTFTHIDGSFWSSCLNSDIAKLQEHGLSISRHSAPYERTGGGKAHFKRYYIGSRDTATKALELLNHYRKKRGAYPLSSRVSALLVGQYPTMRTVESVQNTISPCR